MAAHERLQFRDPEGWTVTSGVLDAGADTNHRLQGTACIYRRKKLMLPLPCTGVPLVAREYCIVLFDHLRTRVDATQHQLR